MWITGVCILAVLLKPISSSFSESYLGCYNENITIEHGKQLIDYQNMTRLLCAEYCLSESLLIYGLQFGTYCHCSADDEMFTGSGLASSGESDKCNKRCIGGQKCGGNDVIAVYNGSNYHKCFELVVNTLPQFGGKIENLKMETCLHICKNLFIYTYVTQGNKCYCSNELPSTSQVEDSRCLTNGNICLGEERCGGGAGVIAVWRIDNRTQCCVQGDTNEDLGSKSSFADILKEHCVWTTLVSFVLGLISAILVSYGKKTYFVRSRMSKVKQRLRRKKTKKKIKSLINYKDENYLRRSIHLIEEVDTAVSNVNTSSDVECGDVKEKVKKPKPNVPPKGPACSRYTKKYVKESHVPRASIYQDAELYSNIVLNNKMQKPTRKKPIDN